MVIKGALIRQQEQQTIEMGGCEALVNAVKCLSFSGGFREPKCICLHAIQSWAGAAPGASASGCWVKVPDVGHQAGTSEMAKRSQGIWIQHWQHRLYSVDQREISIKLC